MPSSIGKYIFVVRQQMCAGTWKLCGKGGSICSTWGLGGDGAKRSIFSLSGKLEWVVENSSSGTVFHISNFTALYLHSSRELTRQSLVIWSILLTTLEISRLSYQPKRNFSPQCPHNPWNVLSPFITFMDTSKTENM